MGNGIAGAAPANFYPPAPPPIPDAPPAPPPIPGPPGPQMSPGDPRVLAILKGGGAGDLGINLVGDRQPTGQYADMLSRQPPQSAGAAQPPPGPAAQPAPVPRAATSLQPAPAPQQVAPAQAIGAGGLQSYVKDWQNNPDSKPYSPASLKPDFHDNLLRFGLAAMASGGKPGATTLGALGEAGTSTFDALQKARQGDITNALEARKAGVSAQSPILKAYEVIATLQQRSADHTLSLAVQQQNMQMQMELRAAIASGNQNLVAEKIAEIARRTDEMAASNADKAGARASADEDRKARQAETINQNAATDYTRRYDNAAKMNPLGVTPEAEAGILKDMAVAHPQSAYPQQWAAKKQDYLDTVRQGLAANPGNAAMRKQAIDKLRSLGINPREL